MSDSEARLNDADLQKVVARALELQEKNEQALTVAQIRELASELAIPESAIDQALLEYRDRAAQPPSSIDATAAPSFWARSRLVRSLVISLGVVGGALVLLIVVSIVMRA